MSESRIFPSESPLLSEQIEVRCDAAFDDQLAVQWDHLLAHSSADSVFLTSGWLRAWHETFGQNRPLIIPQIRIDGDLVAAAAFHENNGAIEFAGTGPSDYSDVSISSEVEANVRTQLINKLLIEAKFAAQSCHHFRLGRIQPESELLRVMADPSFDLLATAVGDVIAAPYLDTSFVEERLRKKSLRRHEHGLERCGNVASATFAKAAEILPKLDEFFDQHVKRWQFSGEQSLFLQEHAREFYRRLTNRLDATGQIRFTTVRLDGRLVAAHFGFYHAKRFIWYKPTFEPDLAKLSPGEVLIKKLLELARDEGAQVFDFTIGNEPFKLRFASGVRELRYLHVTDSRAAAIARRSRAFVGRRVRALTNGVRSLNGIVGN